MSKPGRWMRNIFSGPDASKATELKNRMVGEAKRALGKHEAEARAEEFLSREWTAKQRGEPSAFDADYQLPDVDCPFRR
jgi:hypothetical protein